MKVVTGEEMRTVDEYAIENIGIILVNDQGQ